MLHAGVLAELESALHLLPGAWRLALIEEMGTCANAEEVASDAEYGTVPSEPLAADVLLEFDASVRTARRIHGE